MSSPRNKIAKKLAPILRKLQDVRIDIIGTPTQLLRISQSIQDDFGYSTISYESQVIDNCFLRYPLNTLELFESRENEITNVNSISIYDILPVELLIKFEGDYVADQIQINKGDFFIDVVYDYNDNALPIILQVEKPTGGFLDKFLVTRKYDLSLVRGKLPVDVQTQVDNYLNSL